MHRSIRGLSLTGLAIQRLGWKPFSPACLALSYLLLATTSSLLAAYCEHRLFKIQFMASEGHGIIGVMPLDRNYSTLADFLILNPLVIFFLQRSRLKARQLKNQIGISSPIPIYHRVGLMILSGVFGVYAMIFYVRGSQFFDATLVPTSSGGSRITLTGWIVYSWTALYIAGLMHAFIEHGVHVNRVVHLRASEIPYRPFDPDEAGGVRLVMAPSLNFGYAMLFLFVTFIVFIVQDKLLYNIESNRLIGFAVYVAFASPLFGLPFFHLHTLMKKRRDKYFFCQTTDMIEPNTTSTQSNNLGSAKDYISALEDADRLHKIVRDFPTWPIPARLAVAPFGSIVAASLPLIQKLVIGVSTLHSIAPLFNPIIPT